MIKVYRFMKDIRREKNKIEGEKINNEKVEKMREEEGGERGS